jgi:ABC-type dipeptide/oligopeptide/nickel transport system permease component
VIGFLVTRILSLALVLWLVTIIAFVVMRLAPGDP